MSLSVHHGGSDVMIGAPFDASMIRPLVDEPTVGSGAGGPPLFPGSISIPEYAITEPSLSTARRFFSAANLYMGVGASRRESRRDLAAISGAHMNTPAVDLGGISAHVGASCCAASLSAITPSSSRISSLSSPALSI